jgi:hypothetical protein
MTPVLRRRWPISAPNFPGLQALLPAHNTPWVAPGALIDVEKAFQVMRSGEAQAIDRGDGMIEYRMPGISQFSFLLSTEQAL